MAVAIERHTNRRTLVVFYAAGLRAGSARLVRGSSRRKKWTPKPGQRLKWNLHRVSGRRAEAGCAEVHHIWRPPTK